MASKKNSLLMRVDPEFLKELRKLSMIRLNKGFARFNPRELGTAEMTRLLRRTQGWQQSVKELMTKPKRREF